MYVRLDLRHRSDPSIINRTRSFAREKARTWKIKAYGLLHQEKTRQALVVRWLIQYIKCCLLVWTSGLLATTSFSALRTMYGIWCGTDGPDSL